VIIYSRPGCHLCDEAKEAIDRAGCGELYTLEVVNIESARDLLKKYQYDIPVVLINGTEHFRHRVDTEKFERAIRAHT
jgi:glutaredoxin